MMSVLLGSNPQSVHRRKLETFSWILLELRVIEAPCSDESKEVGLGKNLFL